MSITTTALLSAPVQQTYNRRILSTPVANFIYKNAAEKMTMPRNGGTTLRSVRFNPLQTALVPLGNGGQTPPPQNLTAVNIDAKISFYGTYLQINEQVTLQSQDPVLNNAAKRLGVSLRETEDTLTRDMLAATASAINASGGNNGDNPSNLSLSDASLITQTLLTNNAYMVMQHIEGEDRFGTSPVRDSYVALASTRIVPSLESIPQFKNKNSYPDQSRTMPTEWGTLGNLRFFISSIGSYTASSSALGRDVYNIFCVGMEAYSVIEQDGYSAQFIYRPPIFDGPLALNCSVGYKFAEVPRILNDQWVINLRVTL